MSSPEVIKLNELEPFVPAEIVGHASVEGAITTTLERLAKELLKNRAQVGVQEQTTDELVDFIRNRVGESVLPRVGPDQTLESMGVEAARKAVEMAKEQDVDPRSIGLIVFATDTAKRWVPDPSKIIHRELASEYGLSDNCRTFTLVNACQGGLDAMMDATYQLKNLPDTDTALIVASEVISERLDPADLGTQTIFSDMASSLIVRHDPELESGIVLDGAAINSSTTENLTLEADEEKHMEMDGPRVARAIAGVGKQAVYRARTMGHPNLSQVNNAEEPPLVIADLSDLAVISAHQPSGGMFDMLLKQLEKQGVTSEMMKNYFHLTGNASSAVTLKVMDITLRAGKIAAGSYHGLFSAAVGSSARFVVFKH